MLSGLEANQVILLFILATVILLFTEWFRIGLTTILKVPVWHNLIIAQVDFGSAGAQFQYFIRRELV